MQILALISSLLLLILVTAESALAVCSASNKCGSASPCCSSAGFCGSTAEYCLAACNPMGSFSLSSCAAMPTCQNQHIDFTSNQRPYVALSTYQGDPSQAPLTLDSGSVRTSSEGIIMELSKANQAEGTVLSTTRYLYYGEISAVMKHNNQNGIVSAFITMSPTYDEIDYEFTTSDEKQVQTNFFWTGKTTNDHNAKTIDYSRLPSKFSLKDFHKYTVKWNANSISWLIDDSEVRSIQKTARRTRKKGGSYYEYPATPSRVQLSLWCAGCPGNAKGTRNWAGGKPDWSKVDSKGTFTTTVKSLTIKCDTPNSLSSYPALSYSSAKDSNTAENKIVGTNRKTTI
ncbi:unnamed protein product [Sympodiomycopsis kandeliae]